jgi:hypothetical protein
MSLTANTDLSDASKLSSSERGRVKVALSSGKVIDEVVSLSTFGCTGVEYVCTG